MTGNAGTEHVHIEVHRVVTDTDGNIVGDVTITRSDVHPIGTLVLTPDHRLARLVRDLIVDAGMGER